MGTRWDQAKRSLVDAVSGDPWNQTTERQHAETAHAAQEKALRFESFKAAKDRELASVQARLGQHLWKFIPAAQKSIDEHTAAGRTLQAAGAAVELARLDAYVSRLKGMEEALLIEVKQLAKTKPRDWDEGLPPAPEPAVQRRAR